MFRSGSRFSLFLDLPLLQQFERVAERRWLLSSDLVAWRQASGSWWSSSESWLFTCSVSSFCGSAILHRTNLGSEFEFVPKRVCSVPGYRVVAVVTALFVC